MAGEDPLTSVPLLQDEKILENRTDEIKTRQNLQNLMNSIVLEVLPTPQCLSSNEEAVPLWYAVQQGKWSLFEKSLNIDLKGSKMHQNSLEIHRPDPDYLASPLHWAVINERPGMTAKLLSMGADPNYFSGTLNRDSVLYQNPSRSFVNTLQTANQIAAHGTPLHWSAVTGSTFISDLLLHYGSDISIRDEKGYSPLLISVQHLHWFYTYWLLVIGTPSHSVEATLFDTDGHSLIHWAVFRNYSVLELKLLLSLVQSAQIHQNNLLLHTDKHGRTALHWAIDIGHIDLASFLINLCPEASLMKDSLNSPHGNTPADIAKLKKYHWYPPWLLVMCNLKKVNYFEFFRFLMV